MQSKPIERKEALNAVNRFLSDSIHPASPNQVRGIETQRLGRWLRNSTLGAAQKEKARTLLKPVLADPGTVVVMMRDVRLKRTDGTASVALIGIPEALKAEVRADLVTVFSHASEGDDNGGEDDPEDDGNMQPTCRYHRCFRASPEKPGSCVTATQFNEECPDDECSSDEDCGGGGGGGGGGILETLGAF